MNNKTCRLAVLLSGTGSTMVNLHDKIVSGEVPAQIAVVVSSRKKAPGLERAMERQIPAFALTRRKFECEGRFDKDTYSKALVDLIEPFEPHLVVLAGFMTKLGADLLEKYDVVNVHPALLPSFGGQGFYGHRVHEAVLASGANVTGATVHFVDEKYDHGPIILQETLPVLEGDTPDSLAQRVQAAERRVYPRAIALYAKGLIERRGGSIRVLAEESVRISSRDS
jgi:formyltetrahydrofolate-dependent phosphoribosylglycinamide formyltransferase